MGASPSRPTSTSPSTTGPSSSQYNEKRVESVTESMTTLTVQPTATTSGKPLSADGIIKLGNFEQWESEIAEVCATDS